ncbi:MAG TPA: hypothetical protein VH986_06435 [Acidimicrobiia bacterium]
MAIVMQMEWNEVRPEQYDEARRVVDWEGTVPDGAVLHAAWFGKDGLRVWDVWESAEQFDTFTNERLMPGVAEVGIDGQPNVTILPCHAYQFERVQNDGNAVVELGEVPQDVYDALAAKVDWTSNPPEGGLAHMAARGDDGTVRLLSVWSSASAAEAFDRDRVAPAAEALGMDVPDDATDDPEPLHRMFAAPGAGAR